MAEVQMTMELDMEAIEKLKKIFNTNSDREAVNKALRLVASEDEIIEYHQELAGTIDLDDMFR